MKIVIGLLGITIVIIGGLVFVDVGATPTAPPGKCPLVKRTILPDICTNSCKVAFDCTTSTRPYGLFFSQAATCDDAVICQ